MHAHCTNAGLPKYGLGFQHKISQKGELVLRYDDGEVVSRIFIPKCGSPCHCRGRCHWRTKNDDLRTGVPGLAMSRSMGDGCLKK